MMTVMYNTLTYRIRVEVKTQWFRETPCVLLSVKIYISYSFSGHTLRFSFKVYVNDL